MKTLKITLALAAVLSMVDVGVQIAHAQSQPPRTPPPEAIAACSGAKDGDTCTVKLGEHEMTGTCATTPDNVLACRPNGPPPGPPPN